MRRSWRSGARRAIIFSLLLAIHKELLPRDNFEPLGTLAHLLADTIGPRGLLELQDALQKTVLRDDDFPRLHQRSRKVRKVLNAADAPLGRTA